MNAHKFHRPNTKGNRRINSALALSLAGAMLFASVPSVTAADAKSPESSASEKADMKVSQDGFNAMRAIHGARIAIFDGKPKLCDELLTKASKALAKASKDESIAKVKGDMIPIDGSLALADTYVASEERAKLIAAANEHFKKGNSKAGIETLKLGEIDVTFSRVLISLNATKKRIAQAEGLAKEHKYYECNLALKAAEDAVVLESVSLLEYPETQPKAPASAEKPVTKEK